MKKSFLISGLILLIIIIGAFSIIKLYSGPPSENTTEESSCIEMGGTWARFGLLGIWMCNLPTSDKDNSCSDSDQCEVLCITEETDLANIETTGKCYGWTVTLGTCLNSVEDGKTQGTICSD